MATTANFGWTTPDDTDLVKDGASAIRTLGSAIDTSLVDLKGGTTGQILSKASDTDMDFTWATDASGIPATIFDAKGDIIAASAADTAARLAVGANGTVLSADSAETTGLKWITPAAGGKVLQVVSATLTGSTSTTSGSQTDTGLTATITPSSASSKILVMVSLPSGSTYRSGSGTTAFGNYFLVRGASTINQAPMGVINYASTSGFNIYCQPNFIHLDSPSTTSATTYKLQYSSSGGISIYANDGTGTTTISLFEIGA